MGSIHLPMVLKVVSDYTSFPQQEQSIRKHLVKSQAMVLCNNILDKLESYEFLRCKAFMSFGRLVSFLFLVVNLRIK